MMNTKKVFGTVLIAVVGGLIAVFIYAALERKQSEIVVQSVPQIRYVNLPDGNTAAPSDFSAAAEKAVHAVVHVKTKAMRQGSGNPLYDFFFGYKYYEPQPVIGYGSGVIITSNGYIVTNNHVISGFEEIEVILNDKRNYDAKIVGKDPNTDLAVLKVKADNLPYLTFGSSDNLRLGEWVLAIGNPYNLTSTVTAGIVSAKARNINIHQDQLAIEAFIQTDAAVNPGNSGGALVNTRGELVGINAAIASRTGAFSGYSFAIPVSIVQKAVNDIIEFGTVQRAILGVTITELTAEYAKENNINQLEGVLITGIRDNGAADRAGIEQGDVIIAVNGVRVYNPSELQEQVSRYRPGEMISVTFLRNNKEKQIDVVLRNLEGGTGVVKKEIEKEIAGLGASFGEVSGSEKRKLGINYGLKVTKITSGKFKSAGIHEGFIITKINDQPINTVDDITEIISNSDRGVYVEGVYPNGLIAYYAIRL